MRLKCRIGSGVDTGAESGLWRGGRSGDGIEVQRGVVEEDL